MNDFEGLTFPTEQMAYEAGYAHYELADIVVEKNSDGSWYVYLKDEE